MTRIHAGTCQHYQPDGCTKHQNPDLTRAVGHSCCGRCSQGRAHKTEAWGHAPLFEHAYYEGLVTPGVCTICKQGPH